MTDQDPRRLAIRETCVALSDQALSFQLATAVGGMHREELLAEQTRRQRAVALANRLAQTITRQELVALAWTTTARDDETTPDLLRAYAEIARRRGWTTI